MKNGNEQAFPGERFDGDGNYNPKGITKREYFAAMAMQGLLANGNGNLGSVGEGYSTNNERIAAVCFYLADAMLAESEKSDCDK